MKIKGTPWAAVWVGKDVHAVPIGDTLAHKKSRYCQCGVRFEDGYGNPSWSGDSRGIVVIHKAYDGRPEE